MPTFDDMLNRAAGLAESAAEATRRTAHSARLSVKIAAQQDRLRTAYARLGELTYAGTVLGREVSQEAVEQCNDEIRAILNRLGELNREKNSRVERE